jgi:glucose-fructose oxidoreductase
MANKNGNGKSMGKSMNGGSRSARSSGKRKVRYGIVGLGWISQSAMMPGFEQATKNSEMVALFSDDSEKLQKLGRKYGVKHQYSYDDYERGLEEAEVDAVYIGLPNHMHAEYTIRAAKAGVHVLCEKPMAVTEAECERMIKACRDNDVKLMIAYRLHLEPANLRAVELIKQGKLGDVRCFVSTNTMDVEPGNIRLDPVDMGGGPIYDIGVYCINAARYLLQAEPEEVYARFERNDDPRFTDSEEMASVVMRFPGNRLGSFTCSFNAAKVSTYSVIGTKGTLTLDPAYGYGDPLKHELVIGGKMQEKEFKPTDQFGAQLLYFSDCVLNDRGPEPNGEEGLADVHIIRAIHQSARTNKPVQVKPLQKAERPSERQKVKTPPAEEPEVVKARPPGGSN